MTSVPSLPVRPSAPLQSTNANPEPGRGDCGPRTKHRRKRSILECQVDAATSIAVLRCGILRDLDVKAFKDVHISVSRWSVGRKCPLCGRGFRRVRTRLQVAIFANAASGGTTRLGNVSRTPVYRCQTDTCAYQEPSRKKRKVALRKALTRGPFCPVSAQRRHVDMCRMQVLAQLALVWDRCCRDKPPQLVIVGSIVAGQVCSLLRVPLWDLCCCEVVAVDPEVVLVVFFPS
ncbi:hypothetical protein GEV33_014383 [Tenebrio molitor]|uniref:Uncharacterized protein n=1 Tax=Tenebrio molitor TaxID=7067 RepID=A0A8J6H5E3_TENMO|nr:hypothetical protein GEV33_014383 [Tenebrio molitor]